VNRQLDVTWFATDQWKPEFEFLSFRESESHRAVLILASASGGDPWADVDNAVSRLWHAIRTMFPKWIGERPTLYELWFFAPDAADVCDQLAELTREPSAASVHVVGCTIPPGARARVRAINSLGAAFKFASQTPECDVLWQVTDGAIASSTSNE